MILLAIDTSAPRLQLALLCADGSTDVVVEAMAQGHAERILPAIGELLARNGTSYGDLERIAVTTGPGSFTGLRIGLSAARGFGLALGIPVIGVPSLQAISLSGKPGTPVVVLLDARRGEAYFQHFFAPGQPIGDPALLPLESAWKRVPQGMVPLQSPFCDIGSLAAYAAGLTASHFPPNPVYVRGADAKPQDAARIALVPAP